MKAKRRQELKTNDLAAALEELRESFRSWGGYVVGALAVIVIVVVIITYMNSARAEAASRNYTELREAYSAAVPSETTTKEQGAQQLTRIGDLANSVADEQVKLDALIYKGELALRWAARGKEGIDPKFLDEARQAFKTIVDNHSARTAYYGRALYGLFQVEANDFAVDGDPKHRERAVEYLEKLRDSAALSGTPLNKLAIDRLNEIEEIFTKVSFPEKPAQATQPAQLTPIAPPQLQPTRPPVIEPRPSEEFPESPAMDLSSEAPMDEAAPPEEDVEADLPEEEVAPADEPAPEAEDAPEEEVAPDTEPQDEAGTPDEPPAEAPAAEKPE